MYRDPDEPEYNNTIGDNMYPLKYFNRPFMQWAVFTEYQWKNIWGINTQSKIIFDLIGKLKGNVDLDLNAIFAENENAFIYPFCSFGFNYDLEKDVVIKFLISNKAMNLDIHYPSFYLLKRFYLLISINSSI
jgi:hypothetical protein